MFCSAKHCVSYIPLSFLSIHQCTNIVVVMKTHDCNMKQLFTPLICCVLADLNVIQHK